MVADSECNELECGLVAGNEALVGDAECGDLTVAAMQGDEKGIEAGTDVVLTPTRRGTCTT